MITTFTLLLQRCGLSHREAATFLGVRLDTVRSWSSGRNPTPDGVIAELRALYDQIETAADRALDVIEAEGSTAGVVELVLARDDDDAQAIGWPCVGAQATMLGIVVAALDRPVRIVTRTRPKPLVVSAED